MPHPATATPPSRKGRISAADFGRDLVVRGAVGPGAAEEETGAEGQGPGSGVGFDQAAVKEFVGRSGRCGLLLRPRGTLGVRGRGPGPLPNRIERSLYSWRGACRRCG